MMKAEDTPRGGPMSKQRIPIDYQLPEHRVILDGGAPVARLEPWEHASHPVDQDRTRRLAATLQQAALGVLVVSQRADGSRRVLDGIHRLAACKLRGSPHGFRRDPPRVERARRSRVVPAQAS